jgi:tryptophanyl-tRNA synthetase
MVNYQDKGDLFCFLANLHSLTSVFDGKTISENINEALIDLLALGIDPDRSVLWVQSDVPEVAELTWYLGTVTPMGLLQRCHSYKDKVAKNIPASSGLFIYPVLMAADILLYNSNIVPVGMDQKQHVEVTRDIAIKFNSIYGDVFVIPEAEIREEMAVIPGTDGQKMSKSYDNIIEIFAPEKQLRKKIMSIVTDSTPVEEPKDPDKSHIYTLYSLFVSQEDANSMAEKFRKGGLGAYINEVRHKGAEKARVVASEVLDKVRKAVGVV